MAEIGTGSCAGQKRAYPARVSGNRFGQEKSTAPFLENRCRPHTDNERHECKKDKPELGRVNERLVQDCCQRYIDGIENRPEEKKEEAGKELVLFPCDRKYKCADRNDDTDTFKEENNQIDSKGRHSIHPGEIMRRMSYIKVTSSGFLFTQEIPVRRKSIPAA